MRGHLLVVAPLTRDGGKFGPEGDIITHLTTILPKSTYEALEYYEVNQKEMTSEQKQQILGMSLSHLNFPNDFEQLLYVLYYNASGNDKESQQIFAAINPVANILSTLVSLYTHPEDVIEDLKKNPQMKDMILLADGLRKKENAGALVATFDL